MIRTQVYLHEQQYHLAKLLAKEENTPFADYIRRGLDMAIAEQQHAAQRKTRKKKQAGGLDAVFGKYACKTSTDIATTHDEIYDV